MRDDSDEAKAVLDRCLLCPPYTYSVEEAFYGVKPLWTQTGDTSACNPCPRGKAECVGGAAISPIPGLIDLSRLPCINALHQYLTEDTERNTYSVLSLHIIPFWRP